MTDTLGQMLREARESRGESLEDVERVTHIRPRQLSALEADNYAALPSPAQARGYVKNYAQHLGLDVQEALGQYEAEQKRPPLVPVIRPSPVARAAPTNLTGSRSGRPVGGPAQGEIGSTRSAPSQRPAPEQRSGAGSRSAVGSRSAANPAPVRVRRPRLLSPDVLIAAIITVLLSGLLLWGARQLAAGVAASGTATQGFVVGLTTVQPQATATRSPEATATVSLPTAAASYSGVNISVRAEQRSWVSVKVDGVEAFAGLMPPGETRDFVGQGVVEVVTGNGLGTRVVWNGADQGLMGDLGQVVDLLWTLQGEVIPTATITSTPSATPSATP